MAQETVKQITQGGVTRPVEDEVARQKADSAIQGVIVNGTEVAPDSGTKKVSFNIPSPAQVDNQMSGTSENAVQNKVIKAYVDAVSQRIDTLIGSGNVQGAIDTFNEVVTFLNGINSSDTLAAKLLLKQDTLVAGNGITIAQDGKTVSVAESIRTGAAAGATAVQSVTVESEEDGTVDIHVDDNTYTINLNHKHPQYQPLLTAGSNITITTDPQTGEVTISAAGGGGGISGITMNGTAVTVNNGVANLGTVLTEHQSLAGRVQSQDVVNIVKITQSAYDALSTKDSTTLYLITGS